MKLELNENQARALVQLVDFGVKAGGISITQLLVIVEPVLNDIMTALQPQEPK